MLLLVVVVVFEAGRRRLLVGEESNMRLKELLKKRKITGLCIKSRRFQVRGTVVWSNMNGATRDPSELREGTPTAPHRRSAELDQKQTPTLGIIKRGFFFFFCEACAARRGLAFWLACMMRCEREEDLFMLVHAVFRFRSPSAIVLLIIPSESTLRVVMPSTYTWLGPEREKQQ